MHRSTCPRRPHRRARLLTALAVSTAVLILPAAPAIAHEGHEPLPPGFRAEIVEIVDGDGEPASLPDVTFSVAVDGIGLTVANDSDLLLVVAGEQAGERLVQVTATAASINATSPQAIDVDGAADAGVDPEDAAPLLDLVWDRVEPIWVPLAEGGSVAWIDHRAAPGHPPDRDGFASGEIAGDWSVPFTLAGDPYRVLGRIVAVPIDGEAADSGRSALIVALVVGVAAGGAGAIWQYRRAVQQPR